VCRIRSRQRPQHWYWDKAAEHAARCAPYLHHKLAPVERSTNRKLSEMTTEELETAAQEAREELEQLTENEGALVQDAVTKSVRQNTAGPPQRDHPSTAPFHSEPVA
jgi:hypothetical protein